MTFGENIRQIRRINKLNQTEFGKMLGVSQITVCGWEIYGKVPSHLVLIDIIKKFDVTFEELFDDYF